MGVDVNREGGKRKTVSRKATPAGYVTLFAGEGCVIMSGGIAVLCNEHAV